VKLRLLWLACAVVLVPALAGAQVVAGSAAWTLGRGSNESNGQPSQNDSFWQDYTLGYTGSLLDARLLKFNAEIAFRTNSLNSGGVDYSQQGNQRDLGYKLGASLFPARPFPFFIQASRDTIDESGNYPSSSGIRGGIAVPPGVPTPDFRTRNTAFSTGWQLSVPSLPRIDVGYRKGHSLVTGGPYSAEQRDEDLHLGVSKETARTQHALRYQWTTYENQVSQAFNQRLSDLEYVFGATLQRRSRASVRAGRRTSLSLFDVAVPAGNQDTGAYSPPSRGEVGTTYLVGTINVEPNRRLSLDFTGTFDRQDASLVTTDAKLASATANFEALPGLSLNATGTFGERGQQLGRDTISVITRSGLAGVSYRARVRWLDAGVQYAAGAGTNTTVEGQLGRTGSWAGQANLSASSRWFSVSGGYGRSKNSDDILDYGNFRYERGHAAVQGQAGRVLLNGSWEELLIERGRSLTFARERQRIVTATASLRVGRDSLLSANAGGFRSDIESGRDRSLFAGAAFESHLWRALHLAIWGRLGETTATQTGLDQRALNAFAQLEYRLRFFNFALEYRYNDQNLLSGDLANPVKFRGHQMLLRITRKFGFAL
jgi:hypothetical protein